MIEKTKTPMCSVCKVKPARTSINYMGKNPKCFKCRGPIQTPSNRDWWTVPGASSDWDD